MFDIVIYILIFLIGITCGSIFNIIGNKLSNDKKYIYVECEKCKKAPKDFSVPIFSYLLGRGKCPNCSSKLSIFSLIIELITGILFVLCAIQFKMVTPKGLSVFYSILFISSLIIIIVSDIKYMIIPNEVLIVFGIILAFFKLLMGYFNEEYSSILDVGYSILFLLYDGFFMFFIMYLIKIIGDSLLKKDSLGGGDIKMMFFVSLVMGWKISIVIVFFAAFLALPLSTINMIRKKESMLAFGPYLAISTIIIFLLKIDINMLLEYIL